MDQGGSARGVGLGGGSGGPGHGTPQAFNSAVDLPRARLGRRQRSIGPGRVVDQGGSVRDVGLGGGSVEDLGMNASTLERIRFAAANRLCVDVGYEGDVQRVEPYSLRKARGHIWKTSPPTIRVGLLPGHVASASLRPDASRYRN